MFPNDRLSPFCPNRSTCRRLSYFLLALITAAALVILAQVSPTPAANRNFVSRLVSLHPPAHSSTRPPVHSPPLLLLAETTPEQLLQEGQDQYTMGQFAAAIQLWQQAAAAFGAQGQPLRQAKTLNQVAIAHHQLGEWSQADAARAESLAAITGTGAEISADGLSVLGQIFNTEGRGWLLRSQPTQALTAFEQAATYYRQARDNQGLLHCQINQAQALQALGFYRRALTLLSDLQPRLMAQSDEVLKSVGLRNLGNLLRITGELTPSEVALQEGLAIAQATGQASEMAATLYSLGQTVQSMDNPEAALAYYQQTAIAAPTPILTIQAQIAQFSLLNALERTSEAQSLLVAIQTQLEALPTSRFSVYAQLALARQLMDLAADYAAPQIGQWLAIAVQQAHTLDDARAASFALGYLGELYQQQQQYSEAQTLLLQALNLSEQAAADDITYRWQWQLGQLKQREGDAEGAIAAYTSAVDTLQSLRLDLVTINPDLQFDFREQVEPVYRELVNLLLTTAQTSDAGSQTKLLKARDVIESLQLAELENFFREPCLAVQQQIDQVVDRASSPTAVLYPIILPDRLEVILKLPNQPLQHYSTAISQTELEAEVENLRRQIVLPYALRGVQTLATQLYDGLLKPAEVNLADAQIETLVFVLDGVLRNIPMAVLYDGQQYLVEKYNLALAPGLQLVDPQPLKAQTLAVIAAGLSEARHGFAPLDFVRTEVQQIQETLTSRILLNQTFTQNTLEAEINQTPYPIVHLATHGQFSSNREETFILAWDTPIAINTLNRLLRNSEQNRQDAIELLVLSACETASGDRRAALGLAGVAVRAGARSTLASLWNLDDETSAVLMDAFYQTLMTTPTTKAAALRQAQLALLQNPGYQHPRYWAPYVLVGNWL
ncbi:MAG: CHAT domain-containing protein [Cyanobacteria bacterium J06639_14]